jgi:glutathione S-transferase
MITLYHISPSRSSIILWMLEELGQPYQVKVLDGKAGDNRQPAYLAINPMGKVPAIDHDGIIITESGAIATYLADRFPEAKLNVPLSDPRRADYLKWLFFSGNCLEPAMIDKMFNRPDVMQAAAGWGSYDLVMDVLTNALKNGSYLLGETFTAADIVIGSGLRWGMMVHAIPERPEFINYIKRLEARPALQRATAKDQEFANAA